MKKHADRFKIMSLCFCIGISSIALYGRWFRKNKKEVIETTYQSHIAEVRFGNELHPEELEYLQNRRPKIRVALEKILGMSLENEYQPTISLVCSGGGYRAMLGSIGAFSGLQAIGLFDAVTYISTLSGSTWALGLLISTQMTVTQLKRYIVQRLTTDFYEIRRADARLMGNAFFQKLKNHQSLTTVDLFGAFLAKDLFSGHFGNNCQKVHLSGQSDYVKEGNVPFPIYTAIDGQMGAVYNPAWYEFTPFEIGSAEYAAYVPSWAFGRRFDKGKSINFVPEQSLGFLFGIFGSAFCGHVGLAWDRVLKDLAPSFMKSAIETFLVKTKIAQLRISWARVRNFMFGVENNSLKKNKNLKLVDSGIASNLPYLPVSGQRPERKSDIMIFFDFSQAIPLALKQSEEYARSKGLKFPVIDYTDIEKRTISIFKDEQDSTVPVVIYMPRISDKNLWEEKKQDQRFRKYRRIKEFNFDECTVSGFCKTLNFNYRSYESQQIMDQMEFNVVANQDTIIDAIRWVVEQKLE
jgi:cytosolic phospholipase A2